MSWVRIDDCFEDHEKVVGLSDAAHRLWMRANCWCAKPENWVTRGFIPERQVVAFVGGSKARARRLAKELVDARGEPQFGHQHGLWHEEPGGWRFHDWEQYRPKDEKSPSDLSATRSEAGRRGAQARWGPNGHGKADGKRHGKPDGKPMANLQQTPWQTDAPDPDPDPDPPATDVAAPLPPGGSSLASRALAVRVPIGERCRALLRDPHMGEWCEPQTWPEVSQVVDEFGRLTKTNARLGTWPRDYGVKALIELFAAGFSPEEVCSRLPGIVSSAWWTAAHRGLSSLSVEVLRRSEMAPASRTRQPDNPALDFSGSIRRGAG